MKTLIAALLALSSFQVMSHEIEGVLMLKGSLKTETRVNAIKTTCKVKVEDVKNLMEEDQYGNPAYKVKVSISLKGKKINFNKTLMMNNLFSNGVRDLEYQGEGIGLKITDEGRLSKVRIPFQGTSVVCDF